MAKYKVTFKKSVAKDLRNLPKADIHRILEKIDAIAQAPRADGCIKLSAQELYRVRQGMYRIVYEIRDQTLIVNVVKVAHRAVSIKAKIDPEILKSRIKTLP